METALPGLDGVSTARAIVTERPVPVILLTGYVGAELVRRAREAGVVAYLPSVDRGALLSVIAVRPASFGGGHIAPRGGGARWGRLAARGLGGPATLLS